MSLTLDLDTELLNRFGHRGFRPGQRALIEAILGGNDALGVMPTGGGKSLCFQLPAVLLEGTAVVVSPLIALMKDQVDALRARGIAADAFNSSLTASERRRARAALAAGTTRILYIAPERMREDGFMELLGTRPVSLLTIDEAHCISHWGHDFRPDYRRLSELRRLLRGPDPGRPVPTIALTATATGRVQDDIVERLELRGALRVVTGFRRDNLAFEVAPCATRNEKLATLGDLLRGATADGGSAIVYAATRKNVERVAQAIKATPLGPLTAFYHAGLEDREREEAQDAFLAGRTRVLVATNAFGMGIDKPDVRLVAHYDIPGSVEAYYQEAGRAGRDGRPARCALLFNYADVATQEFFIERSTENEERVQSQKALLKQLVRYAYASSCRQQLVLEYFGDPEAHRLGGGSGRCGACDRCAPAENTRERHPVDDRTHLAARQALAAVARLNGRFGKIRICELLKGSQSAALLATGLQHDARHGLLGDRSMSEIRELLDALIRDEYLRINGLEYPVLGITPSGVHVMKDEARLRLSRLPGGAAPGDSGARVDVATTPVPAADPDLLAELKAFRRSEAQARNVPAYVVFHDRTLEELAARRPSLLEALAEITGFGPKKIETYGERVLAIIKKDGQDPSASPVLDSNGD